MNNISFRENIIIKLTLRDTNTNGSFRIQIIV
jgi:hypothetical protein